MSDVHAIVDVLAFLEQTAQVVAQVAADGKINLADLTTLYSLLGPAQKAIKEFQDAVAEAKTLDLAGIEAVVSKVVELGALVTTLVKNALPKA